MKTVCKVRILNCFCVCPHFRFHVLSPLLYKVGIMSGVDLQHIEGFFVTPLHDRHLPFVVHDSIHLKSLCDIVLWPGERVCIPIACSINIPHGYVGYMNGSTYMPQCMMGRAEGQLIRRHEPAPLMRFTLSPHLEYEVFIPAGTVVAQVTLRKCHVEGCNHSLAAFCM